MFRKGLAILVAAFAIFSGVIWYNAYLPISPKLMANEKMIPFLFNVNNLLSQIVGEKMGIVPKYKVFRWFFATTTRIADFFSSSGDTAIGVTIKDSVISGVRVKIFQPAIIDAEGSQDRPGLIYLHGGGLAFGSVNWPSYILQCSMLAEGTKSVVISVEYRLAPEHAIPAQFDDCYTVVQTVANEPSRFGIIKNKIALAGDSAGGMLSAAISLEFAKQNRSSELAAQVLIYPLLQLIDIKCLPSYQENKIGFQMDDNQTAYFFSVITMGDGVMEQEYRVGNVTRYFMKTPFWKFLEIPKTSNCNVFTENTNVHLSSAFLDKVLDPHVSPLLANTLEGSPATLLVIPEYDILASEGFLYAKRLKEAGVSVVLKTYKTYHAFLFSLSIPYMNTAIANQAMEDIVTFLNSTFYT